MVNFRMSYFPHAHPSDDHWGSPNPAPFLNPGPAIVLIAVLSLGFWAALWLVVADLLQPLNARSVRSKDLVNLDRLYNTGGIGVL
jgi:hypothetical protein